MIKLIKWIFTNKLGYFIINTIGTAISICTIVVLCFNLTGLNGEINSATLFVLILNSLLLGVKTSTKAGELFMEYTEYLKKQQKLEKLIPGFKECLNENNKESNNGN